MKDTSARSRRSDRRLAIAALFVALTASAFIAASAAPAPAAPGAADTSDDPAADNGIAVLERAVAPMTGDLDAMRKLGRVRVLVSFSRTNFFVSQGRPRGFDCDLMAEYQRVLLQQLKAQRRDMNVVFVP